MNRAVGNNVGATVAPTSKSIVQDTAGRLGVSPSSIKSQVRAAKNTIPEAKEIIRESGVVVSKKDAVRLSQLEPEQQKEAASRSASGTIRFIKEFCEDDSQPEAPRQRKRIDLDSISDEEFHILQAVCHPVSDEQYAKVLAKFTEHTEETVQWLNAFSTLLRKSTKRSPETKHSMRNEQTSKDCKLQSLDAKPFAQDAAGKLGVGHCCIAESGVSDRGSA